MGLIDRILSMVFGGGRNVVAETAEVFIENKEAGAQRQADLKAAVLEQFATEFSQTTRGRFNRLIDALNRIPRPALALGTLGLFVTAMIDPIWFSQRMQGLALVPEPMWWLMGAIVSFYFGARHQLKSQEFQRSVAETIARAPQIVENLHNLQNLYPDHSDTPQMADTGHDSAQTMTAVIADNNPALEDWRQHSKQHAAE